MMRRFFVYILLLSSLIAGAQKKKIDMLVFNAHIYTVDAAFSSKQAMAISKGKIIETGRSADLKKKYQATEMLDAKGKHIYPGLIDAHAHFYRYGLGLSTPDLSGTKSWDEIVQIMDSFSKTTNAPWLTARGWDQNDWDNKSFPTKEKLDALFPSRPVVLRRVDGHAAVANSKALEIAGIKAGDTILGGEIETKNGMLTGILVDNAVDLVTAKIPAATDEEIKRGILKAQSNCFAVGLTTVDDCGLEYDEIEKIERFQKEGILKMRIYAMLSDARPNYEYLFKRGKIKTDKLNVRSFKVYADGALGSRGAVLLQPYSDRAGWYGFLLSSSSHFDSVASVLIKKDFQMCTHAIGDSGNREILNIYGKYLKGRNDKRWRIEHAQVVNKNDFALFGRYNIVPSVQPTHATSDMYWAGERLGKEREKGAYAYKQLMQQNGWIPLGTDFPIEDISPIKTFYAAVARKDANDFPKGGYQTENALSRRDALKGMTIWAAKSNFEEKEKGSLEKGKFADFIILDRDILTIAPSEILKTEILATYIDGKKVYGR